MNAIFENNQRLNLLLLLQLLHITVSANKPEKSRGHGETFLSVWPGSSKLNKSERISNIDFFSKEKKMSRKSVYGNPTVPQQI